MAKDMTKIKEGFTIIEVMLVLAIAGLIFLMVFVALPALQRSQRDTQRRTDMQRFITRVVEYQNDNDGKLPGGVAVGGTGKAWNGSGGFISNYLLVDGDKFEDPGTGSQYEVQSPYCTFDNRKAGAVSGSTTEKICTAADGSSDIPDANRNRIYVYYSARCDGQNAVSAGQKSSKIAIRYKLEGGGIYCINN